MDPDWELWGTFSVADHLRPRAFVSDVLVFDRLLVPVPVEEDLGRWVHMEWDPARQAELLDVLKGGNPKRVVEIPWDLARRKDFAERKSELAADAAFDVQNVQAVKRNDPDTPAQWITRAGLADYRDPDRDAQLVQGIPLSPVSVVAAYGSFDDFRADTEVEETDEGTSGADNFLGGFTWPFAVPADAEASDIDLLKRAVEFTMEPEVLNYRRAFHRWRAEMIQGHDTPEEAGKKLGDAIREYGRWVRRQRVTTIGRSACAVFTVAAGVTASVLPALGDPGVGAAVGAGGALAPGLGLMTTRLFRGRLKSSYDPAATPGALFWRAQQALA